MRACRSILLGLIALVCLSACTPADPPLREPILVWLNPRRYPLPWFPIQLHRDSLTRWLPLAPHQLPVLVDSLRGDTLIAQYDDTDGNGSWDTYVSAIRLGRGPLATAHRDSLPRRSFRLLAVDSQRIRRHPPAVTAQDRGELRHDSLLLRLRAGRIHVLQPSAANLWAEQFHVGTTLGLGHIAIQRKEGMISLPLPTEMRVLVQGPIRAILRLTHQLDTVRIRRDVVLWRDVPGFAQEIQVHPAIGVRLVTGLGVARVSDVQAQAVGSTLYAWGPWHRGQDPLGMGLVLPGGWVRKGNTGTSGPHPHSRTAHIRLDTNGRATVWAFLGTGADLDDWEQRLRPWRDALTTPVVFRAYLPEAE